MSELTRSNSRNPSPTSAVGACHRRCLPRYVLPPAAALMLLVLAGCPQDWRRAEKEPVSALWVTHDVDPLAATTIAALKQAGVGEFFIPVAELDPGDAKGPLVPVRPPELPPSTAVTMVVTGELDLGSRDPGDLARSVAMAADQLRFDLEGRSWFPVGLHFDLLTIQSGDEYRAFLRSLRQELDRSLAVSITLKRRWVDDERIRDLAAAADFVVPFLYGQRVEDSDAADAWNFGEVHRRLAALEEYPVPYMVGVIGLGTANLETARGTTKARSSRQSLAAFLWDRRLKLLQGISLEGMDRRLYSFKADRPTTIGDWEIQSGQVVRVVRSSTADLEALIRLLEDPTYGNRLGQLYYRVPAREERLSLTVNNLLHALAAEPATPALRLEANVQRRTGRGWLFRFTIRNDNEEITELSMLDNNFLQVTLPSPSFGRLDAGEFYRYDYFRQRSDGSVQRMYRNANIVRLHAPILTGEQTVTSGDVEIRMSRPEFQLRGRFLLPDGRTLDVGPYLWRDGALHGPGGE